RTIQVKFNKYKILISTGGVRSARKSHIHDFFHHIEIPIQFGVNCSWGIDFSTSNHSGSTFFVESPFRWEEISDLPFFAKVGYCWRDIFVEMVFVRLAPCFFTVIMVIPETSRTEPRSEFVYELLMICSILTIAA